MSIPDMVAYWARVDPSHPITHHEAAFTTPFRHTCNEYQVAYRLALVVRVQGLGYGTWAVGQCWAVIPYETIPEGFRVQGAPSSRVKELLATDYT